MNSEKGIVMKLFVVLLVCAIVTGDVEVRCIEREREALLSFKNGLIDEFGILSTWQRSDDCCQWYGVVCSNTSSHVIRLELGTSDPEGVLRGELSSSLLELHHLTYLNLANNDFRGNRIPEFISSMKQLQHLYLSNSGLFGTVPPQIGNLTNLRSLDLSYNSLRTENLNWLSSLSLLSFLDFSQIDLSRTNWLQPILNLHSLQKLNLKSCNIKDVESSADLFVNASFSSLSILGLSDNHFTPSVFNWLSNVSASLVEIDLSQNAFGGLIPNAFERLSRLEYLDLSSNMLGGEIPNSLVNLTHLQVLVLYNNHLDQQFGNLSAKGMLVSLEILDLDANRLKGPVPDFGAFSALTELYLGNNKLTGSVPLSLGQLSKIQVLDLSNNNLEGTVNESHLINFESLKVLDFSFNSLKICVAGDWTPPFQLEAILLAGCIVGPTFPGWIRSQINLWVLDLSGAGIIDEVPMWLWNLSSSNTYLLVLSHNQISGVLPDLSSTSIQTLDVSSNNISGPIPLFNHKMKALQLSHNMLSGPISSLCEISHDSLWFLDLSDNQLSGRIPSCWDNMPNVAFLNLANNSFWSGIPHSLGSLHDLGALQLRENNLSGELPSTLRFCQRLSLIDVGGNKLTGYIPTWMGESYLIYLNFRSNRFYGNIPSELCSLIHIRILDMSRNNFSGKIPDCFNNFTSLAQRNASRKIFGLRFTYTYHAELPNTIYVKDYNEYSIVQWKGQELEYTKTLIYLTLIDFSSNRLIGNIPQSFANMKGLISLNLSRNSLTGNIIPDIGQMEMLECLDLSNNQLSGQIPKSLEKLNFLSVLDLSNNNLSGEIPSSTQLQSFNISNYAGNNGLCGRPMVMCPDDRLRPLPTIDGENGEDDRFWRLTFKQGFIISVTSGAVIGFWGVVGSLVFKKSWRYAYFNFLDDFGDWFYIRITIFLSKW